MPIRALQSQLVADFSDAMPPAGQKRDVEWDRPVFRPPFLPNPRVVFDPLPFRTQLRGVVRQVRSLAGR
jgi:hypothetical protein